MKKRFRWTERLGDRRVAIAAAAVGLLLIPLALAAAPPGGSAQTADGEALRLPAAGSGLTVAVDPATGRLRPPTPEEVRELTAALSRLMVRSSAGLEAVESADGTLSVDLHGRFLNVSLAARTGDGGVALQCVSSPEEASAFLAAPPVTTPLEVR